MERKLLTTEQAAEHIRERGMQIAFATLNDWRYQRRGPAWSKVGHRVYYRPDDLDKWVDQQLAEGRHEPETAAAE